MKLIIKLATSLSLLFIACGAYAIELMTWDRLPLAVPLKVGQERVIFVENNVRIGVPSSLQNKLRVQSTGGNVYLLALEPIEPTRIQLQDAETGALILVDIAATIPDKADPALEPIQIVEGEHRPVRYGQTATNTDNSSQQTAPKIQIAGNATTVQTEQTQQQRETPVPVILTRYAAQNLYAPLRTVEPVSGISQVNAKHELDLKTLLPMLPVKAKVMAAWRLEDYFVTAVSLKNTGIQFISLDPRWLQGNFIAATFQHPELGPKGQSTDITVVYLVTRKHDLAASLLPHLSQIDAQSNIPSGGQSK